MADACVTEHDLGSRGLPAFRTDLTFSCRFTVDVIRDPEIGPH